MNFVKRASKPSTDQKTISCGTYGHNHANIARHLSGAGKWKSRKVMRARLLYMLSINYTYTSPNPAKGNGGIETW